MKQFFGLKIVLNRSLEYYVVTGQWAQMETQ